MTDAPPDDLVAYRATPLFTAGTVPGGLLRDHKTGTGIWGRIEVRAGILCLARAAGGEETLQAGGATWVAPDELHAVTLSEDAIFRVVFHRRVGTG
ncbi:MAG: DUF1971 domain-containing protein [Pseudomonadota bacterium]